MLSFILNLPYTFIGLIVAIISIPRSAVADWRSKAIVIKVKSFWWSFGYLKNMRAATIGNVILLGQKLEAGDLEHEIIHVSQYSKFPLIYPILYYWELITKGYKNNKYEIEAYQKAGNIYKG